MTFVSSTKLTTVICEIDDFNILWGDLVQTNKQIKMNELGVFFGISHTYQLLILKVNVNLVSKHPFFEWN